MIILCQTDETNDDLWKTRKDFKVWIPLLNKPNRDYVITDKFDKAQKYNVIMINYINVGLGFHLNKNMVDGVSLQLMV